MGTIESFFDRYDTAVRSNLDRWREAAKKIDAGTYKPEDYFSDAMYGWLQWTLGLYGDFAILKPGIAIVDIVKDIDETQAFASVEAPAAGDPKATKLTLKRKGESAPDDTPKEIPGDKIKCEFSADRKTLSVRISGIKALGLHAGNTYEGSVKVDVTEIAHIHARVMA